MDLHLRVRDAKNHIARSNYDGAISVLRQVVGETHSIDPDYNQWLTLLAQAYERRGLLRHTAYIYLYLKEYKLAESKIEKDNDLDRAWILYQAEDYRGAAKAFYRRGKLVQAAISYEKAEEKEDLVEASLCWNKLANTRDLKASVYEEALIYFNLGMALKRLGDERANQALVNAQRLLEEAADVLETSGLRERAFDCYQILLELGRRSKAFENLAEGYINCIRILKEDNLKYYALQYYEDFLKVANEGQEYQAAATLYREAAEYCRRMGLIYERHYLKHAARSWRLAAEKNLKDGAGAEIVENFYLAMIDCYNSLGDYRAVGVGYGELSTLDLGERKSQRYLEIAKRYQEEKKPSRLERFPEYLRQNQAYPEIWYLDLVEWELDGDPLGSCATVVADSIYPDIVRRRALVVLLDVLDGQLNNETGIAKIAEGLGDMQIYPVLSPLEKLYESTSSVIQVGVMRAMRFLFFKRTFVLLNKGLDSKDNAVKNAALAALERLHFNHAFDPLVRIFRKNTDIRVKQVALESLGRIPTLEAGDFLVEVMRHEDQMLANTAKRLLTTFSNREIFNILALQVELEKEPMRTKLKEVLQGAGYSL